MSTPTTSKPARWYPITAPPAPQKRSSSLFVNQIPQGPMLHRPEPDLLLPQVAAQESTELIVTLNVELDGHRESCSISQDPTLARVPSQDRGSLSSLVGAGVGALELPAETGPVPPGVAAARS